ncbi:MAG: ABC transporter permease [Xanthomonadales bacterium]|nr:ABC transporter permease [Xanthomonadales bacterium]
MAIDAFRQAGRRLRARPAHAILALLTLSLGLAATLFLFGGLNSMVLRPLPFPDAGRLVQVGWQSPGSDELDSLSAADYARIDGMLAGLEAAGVDAGAATVTLGQGDDFRRYHGTLVDHGLLSLLAVRPLLGRVFTSADDAPGAALTVLVSERVWRNDFQGRADLPGAVVRANGETATVIGVLPDSFGFPGGQDVWLPRRLAPEDPLAVFVTGRIAPDASLEIVNLGLAALQQRLEPEFQRSEPGRRLAAVPLAHRFVDRTTRSLLWAMFVAGLLVLLLTCANVANLQVGQVIGRQHELAICGALGAQRNRLLAELMAEALLLTIAATVLGGLLAHLGGIWVMADMLANDSLPAWYVDLSYDWRDVAFMAAVALATTILAGLVPARRAAGTPAAQALRAGDRGSRGGLFSGLTRGLVVFEIALTVVLLVGAALFLRTLMILGTFSQGGLTDPAQVLTARIGLFPDRYPDATDRLAVFERLQGRLAGEPGVLAASVATGIPGSSGQGGEWLAVPGRPRPAEGHLRVEQARIDPTFADVYGLRLREGRFVDAGDRADTALVAVIDERIADRLFPGESALGRSVQVDPEGDAPQTYLVVGVVEPVHLRPVDASPRPAVLLPLSQAPPRFVTLAVRTSGDAALFAPRLAAVLREVEPEAPPYWVRSQADAIGAGRAGIDLVTRIFTVVGLLALVLAATGLYGVLAFSVARRARELGIRRALGAGAAATVRPVVVGTGAQVLLGLVLGLLAAVPWAALLAGLGVAGGRQDPRLFVWVAGLVVLVAAAAAAAPLRRALRVDPMVALRQD